MSKTTNRPLYIPYAGPTLLDMPLLNKGNAFTQEERREFNLTGLLSHTVETIDGQAERAYTAYSKLTNHLDRHIYLRSLQDDNETLFYRLLEQNLVEMLPVIYTPTVGDACEEFSKIYRNHRGLFVSYPDRDHLDDILRSATKDKVSVIVLTDGERILGLGDQGIGGMAIPIGKLSLYTACGGISPAYTLPIVLDAGTNNQQLLQDPMYMGWRHERVSQDQYNDFVAAFIQAIKRRWPKVLLQFEDFAQSNAMPLLQRYRDDVCCFNDDIQGTAAVCVATVLAACQAKGERISEQRLVFVGAGSAGCGIAEYIVRAMVEDGLTDLEARSQICMVDRDGLLTSNMKGLHEFQTRLARSDPQHLTPGSGSLLDVIKRHQPNILIGVSGQPGLFTREAIEQMHKTCARPIVMPLSNPTSRAEASPADILAWTHGQAIVATGSPFGPVQFGDQVHPVAQCNNVYVFPGIGLGVLAAQASRVTDNMLMAASRALAYEAPVNKTGTGALLPALTDIHRVSKAIAFAVGMQAQADEVALAGSEEAMKSAIEKNFWLPQYRRYRRRAF